MASQDEKGTKVIGQMDILPGEIKQRHLVPQPVNTGDTYYGLYGGNFTRLSIGSSNQVLAVKSGVPAWVNATGPSSPAGPDFPVVESNTSSATPAPAGNTNVFELSAQTATAAFAPSGGTPGNGQPLRVIVTSSNAATARAISWSSATGGYTGNATALPLATTTGKTTIVDFVYTSTNAPAFWRVISAVTGA